MKMSLRKKTMIMLLLVAAILSATAILISYHVYSETMDEHYRTMTMNLAKTEALMVDRQSVGRLTSEVLGIYREICETRGGEIDFSEYTEEDWEEYYGKFSRIEETKDYQKVYNTLQDIAGSNDAVSVYIAYMDVVTGKGIYIIDGSLWGEICRPGTCDDIEDENLLFIQQGIYDFPAYITDYEEYGWLCTASAAIYDDEGNVMGNAYVDISMDEVMKDQEAFLTRLLLVLEAVTCLLVGLLLYMINRVVICPINSLAAAAGTFVSHKEQDGALKEESAIARLQVKTGDEIEKLVDSIQKMEIEINTYIDHLTTVTAEKERISVELNVATQIQSDMLPNIFPAFPEYSEFDIYASMAPAKEVGGDFYDFFMVDEDHLAVVIADVSGKGVPAALFMVIAKTLIKNHTQGKKEPKEVFTSVNNQLCENNEIGMFVTAWMGIMDIHTGHMVYVNAGHNFPIIIRKNGKVEWVKSRPGFVLAGMEGIEYTQDELTLEEGDKLFLYTDGVTEALNKELELYGEERLNLILSEREAAVKEPKELLIGVTEELQGFVGEMEQADDITMLALCFREKSIKWKEILVTAKKEEWKKVFLFLTGHLNQAGCGIALQTRILIAVEEIFVNIASYAYAGEKGDVVIKTFLDKHNRLFIQLEDWGIPYNPLAREEPDITMTAEERKIGGLGIYMVKKSMDEVSYEYVDGKNCLKIEKQITSFFHEII